MDGADLQVGGLFRETRFQSFVTEVPNDWKISRETTFLSRLGKPCQGELKFRRHNMIFTYKYTIGHLDGFHGGKNY